MVEKISSATRVIIDAACEWLICMHDDNVAAADNKAFASWLRESPVHVREYLAAELLWAELAHIDFDSMIAVDSIQARQTDNVVSMRTAI